MSEVLEELKKRKLEWAGIYGNANYAENLKLASDLGDELSHTLSRIETITAILFSSDIENSLEAKTALIEELKTVLARQ